MVSIDLLFIYLIFFKKERKFDFKYLITLEVFLVVLIPHFIWLFNNDFITITYGLARTGLEQSSFLDHIKFPVIFLLKQVVVVDDVVSSGTTLKKTIKNLRNAGAEVKLCLVLANKSEANALEGVPLRGLVRVVTV